MSRLILFTPLLVFGLGGIYLLRVFLDGSNTGPFYDNLLPELIGFCLEGFFLIGLFSLIQRRRERERKEDLRLSLRGALRDILSHIDIGLLGENAEPSDSGALQEDNRVVAELIVKLAENPLTVTHMAKLKSVAQRNLTTIHDLIPVAAQLSADHIRWWLAITDSVRQLCDATDSGAVSLSLHHFLANLGEFDDLEL